MASIPDTLINIPWWDVKKIAAAIVAAVANGEEVETALSSLQLKSEV